MIRTERLLLRRWPDADREPFAAMNADPAVMEHMQGLMSRERSDEFVDRIERHWEEHGWGLWAVEVPGVAPFIGYVGLWPADYLAEGMVEVGWRLARPHWGNGYATEAAREALRSASTRSASTRSSRSPCPRTCARGGSWSASAWCAIPPATSTIRASTRSRYPHLVAHVLYRLSRDEWQRDRA